MEALVLAAAFALGLLFQQLRIPALVGYLAAGFVMQALGFTGGVLLEQAAHIGVLLLLFSVGLKLRLQSLIRPEAWAAGLVHLLITSLLLGAALHTLAGFDWRLAALLAICLGFSSTVLAAKVLEEKKELRAFHGRVAIGILIVQDLVAVALLATMDPHPISWFVLGLLALPLLRPVLWKMADHIGHDELFLLFGLLVGVVIGGMGFEQMGLSAELGALIMGMLLAGHPRAVELSGALWGLKEILLIGFFVQIGVTGALTLESFGIAMLLCLVLPLQAALFFVILVLFRLRARSAFLAALALATYSEFGLIVADLAVRRGWLAADWLVTLAVALALSFAFAAPLNRAAHRLYGRFEPWLRRFELEQQHPDEQPIRLGRAQVLIMGMGRVGSGAYDYFTAHDLRVVGLDSDPGKVEQNLKRGRRVLYADAEDPALWQQLDIEDIRAVVLAMPDFEAKRIATQQLRKRGYHGYIVATSNFPDEAQALVEAGANHTANSFYEVGAGLASHICEDWSDQRERDPAA
jgi:predicted Kef-type K+ transport protein